MNEEHEEGPEDPRADEGGGNMALNILKILFLIAVLTGFWFAFDRWLSGR